MTETIDNEYQKYKKKGTARVKRTAEVFTPADLCLEMVREIPEKKLRDRTTAYLDNSCGDGNFLHALLEVLVNEYGHDRKWVLENQLYGVDLMADNIATVKERLGVDPESPAWDHFVCADGLQYNYTFGPAESQTSFAEEAGVR